MRKYSAEFLGTFVLTFLGCGASAILLGLVGAGGIISIALTFGLAYMAMFYSIGKISGCHINPAVSFAMLINKKLSIKDFIGYVISQFVGAIAAAGLLAFLFNNIKVVEDYKAIGLGANGYGDKSIIGATLVCAIIVEILLTFIFVLTTFGSTSNKKTAPFAGLIIGLTLTCLYVIGIVFTGASLNPARSFGPAIILRGETLKQVWVFIAAPLVGAALAAFAWRFFNYEKPIAIDETSEEVVFESTEDSDVKSEVIISEEITDETIDGAEIIEDDDLMNE